MSKRASETTFTYVIDDVPKGAIKELVQLVIALSQGISRGTCHEIQTPVTGCIITSNMDAEDRKEFEARYLSSQCVLILIRNSMNMYILCQNYYYSCPEGV